MGRGVSRERSARAVLLIGGFLVAVVISELLLRIFGLGYGGVHMVSSDVLHHVHPPDYRFVSYHRSREHGGHVVYYDEAGRRAHPDQSAVDLTGYEGAVAVMGDSFVEALQVAHEDSFVGRLQTAANGHTPVQNYGTSSYGPALYLLQWRHQIRQQRPSYIFLMLFGNDVRNDAEMTAIAQVDSSGEIVAVSGAEQTWFARVARSTYLARLVRKVQLQLVWAWEHWGEETGESFLDFLEENPDITDLTDGYLQQLVRETREVGTQLVLLAVPSKEDTLRRAARTTRRAFHDKVRVWAEQHRVPFVDLATPFLVAAEAGARLFFPRDIHFTEEGHRVVADVLLSAYPKVFAGE